MRFILLIGSLVLIASVALNVWLLTRPRRESVRRRDVRRAREERDSALRRGNGLLDMLVAVDTAVATWSDAESVIASKVREVTRQPGFIRLKHDRDTTPRRVDPDHTMES